MEDKFRVSLDWEGTIWEGAALIAGLSLGMISICVPFEVSLGGVSFSTLVAFKEIDCWWRVERLSTYLNRVLKGRGAELLGLS